MICKTATARSRIRFDEGHGAAARATQALALLLHSQSAVNQSREGETQRNDTRRFQSLYELCGAVARATLSHRTPEGQGFMTEVLLFTLAMLFPGWPDQYIRHPGGVARQLR